MEQVVSWMLRTACCHIMPCNISAKERRVYKKLFGENASHHPVWFVERTMKLE